VPPPREAARTRTSRAPARPAPRHRGARACARPGFRRGNTAPCLRTRKRCRGGGAGSARLSPGGAARGQKGSGRRPWQREGRTPRALSRERASHVTSQCGNVTTREGSTRLRSTGLAVMAPREGHLAADLAQDRRLHDSKGSNGLQLAQHRSQRHLVAPARPGLRRARPVPTRRAQRACVRACARAYGRRGTGRSRTPARASVADEPTSALQSLSTAHSTRSVHCRARARLRAASGGASPRARL